MNEKKAKAIRRLVRAKFKDTEVKYEKAPRAVSTPAGFVQPGTRVLSQQCNRYRVKTLKRASGAA